VQFSHLPISLSTALSTERDGWALLAVVSTLGTGCEAAVIGQVISAAVAPQIGLRLGNVTPTQYIVTVLHNFRGGTFWPRVKQ
jgi:hypothetical protein